MIKKEVLQQMAALLKIDQAKFDAALAAEAEQDIEIPDLSIFTADEIAARDASQVSIGKKDGEREGEAKGKELAVKELKKNFGVEFDGKDMTKLTDALKTQFQKGDDALKQQVQLLQGQLADKDTVIAQTKLAAEAAAMDAKLLSFFPANRKNVEDGGFSDAEYLAAIKANLAFENTDAGTIVKRNGEIVRDAKSTNPLTPDVVVKGYFTERKWDAAAAAGAHGRGGNGGKAGAAITRLSELQKQYEDQGKSIVSAEFQNEAMRLKKENAEFDLTS